MKRVYFVHIDSYAYACKILIVEEFISVGVHFEKNRID